MADTEFTNPIIPGFAPDPSTIFVDGFFFLVNSSFHLFPGLPIYASRDLRSWKQIGNAIHRSSQKIVLKDANSVGFPIGHEKVLVATVGLLAPTIRWHNGIYFVICTNATQSSDGESLITRNFYVTTEDIWSGTWSDPIFFDFKGIDTSLFFDDDNKAYIQGSWREGNLDETVCTIRQLEIDIQTGQLLSETKELWSGFAGKNDAEGPHIYKKDGYYFLITAERGTFEHHAISVARSTSIWGPYESYEKNPILTASETSNFVQNTGHGDLFQDSDGAWWCTCLGIRNDNGRYPLGRETFLTPVSWPKDGWPAIANPRMNFRRKSTALTANSETCLPLYEDNPGVDFLYIRDPNLDDYSFSADAHKLTIVPRNATLSKQTGTSSFVGKRQRSLVCTATVTLQLNQGSICRGIQAGLAVYKEDIRHAEIYFDFSLTAVCFRKELKLKGNPVVDKQGVVPTSKVAFRIRAEPSHYDFEYKMGDEPGWISLGSMDTLEITGYDFSGPILGVFAVGDSEGCPPLAFDDFTII